LLAMKTVGIRELKNSLSEYLRRVRSGESVLVTDRGEIVAELTPPGLRAADPSIPPGLSALSRRGLVTLGAAADPTLYCRLPRRKLRKVGSAQLLNDERGSR